MSDPMISRLDPVTLSKIAQAPRQGMGVGQAGFESVLSFLQNSARTSAPDHPPSLAESSKSFIDSDSRQRLLRSGAAHASGNLQNPRGFASGSILQMLKTSDALKGGGDGAALDGDGSGAGPGDEPFNRPTANESSWGKPDAPASAKVIRPPKTKEEKLSQTAREFEGMLMTQMFQALRKTVEPSGLFGYNQTERGIYEYLFDQSIFQKAAENGQTWGLAVRLEESWKEHFAGNGN